MTSKTRILCVDDEPNVLEGLKRQLASHYDVVTAVGGAAALQSFDTTGPYAIVMSDMRMPLMDGATFLKKVCDREPDTVRLLLTGQTDLDSAIRAVNEGHIFRFLAKPCVSEHLLGALRAAEKQYHLIMAEKILLEDTLQGSIKTLTDILAIANPEAFSRSTRIKSYTCQLLEVLMLKEQWAIKIAAHLSQIGSITLPPDTITKIFNGDHVTTAEQHMLDRIPEIIDQLLANIPRLEAVREILRYQNKAFDGSGLPQDTKCAEQIPLGARILKIIRDYVFLETQGHPQKHILETLHSREGWYDPALFDTFAGLFGNTILEKIQEVPGKALHEGMLLAEDLYTSNNILLVPKGNEITPVLLARIQNFARHTGLKEPIRVKLHIK